VFLGKLAAYTLGIVNEVNVPNINNKMNDTEAKSFRCEIGNYFQHKEGLSIYKVNNIFMGILTVPKFQGFIILSTANLLITSRPNSFYQPEINCVPLPPSCDPKKNQICPQPPDPCIDNPTAERCPPAEDPCKNDPTAKGCATLLPSQSPDDADTDTRDTDTGGGTGGSGGGGDAPE
jgi:hypothetical protein